MSEHFTYAHRLPSLHALRTFEAAARHGNFSRAAAELHITHGAISHQMKALERELGVALFPSPQPRCATDRARPRPRRRRCATRWTASRAASPTCVPGRIARLTVSVLPAFATHWLIPRLADFNRRHPEIDINVRASPAAVRFRRRGRRSGGALWRRQMARPACRCSWRTRTCSRCAARASTTAACPATLADLAKARCCTRRYSRGTNGSARSASRTQLPRRGMTFSETDILLQRRD